jgi:hypothetical protein
MRMWLVLTHEETDRLYALAEREHRTVRQQAAYLLGKALRRHSASAPAALPSRPREQEAAHAASA